MMAERSKLQRGTALMLPPEGTPTIQNCLCLDVRLMLLVAV
jgi:hypothetical protein